MPTSTPPFPRLLVPYDGSEPARAALTAAIGLAKRGAAVTIVTIVDETPVIAQTATTMIAYDPTPLMDALDAQGTALLNDAAAQCLAAGVTPTLTTVHDRPVAGILSTTDADPFDLIIMGTHARTGVARTFLGSTTEGVLRSSRLPVLTIRSVDRAVAEPFATALVAIDDSEPADAAAALAALLARTSGTRVLACHAIDSDRVLDNAAAVAYGFAPAKLVEDMRREAIATVEGALTRAALAEDTPIVIVDGDPARAVIAAAEDRHATVIVAGTHGRRGLRRFVLGSVAENIVRASDIPVLVVPAKHKT